MSDDAEQLWLDIKAAARGPEGVTPPVRTRIAERARAIGGRDLEILAHALMDTERTAASGPADQSVAVSLIRESAKMTSPVTAQPSPAPVPPARGGKPEDHAMHVPWPVLLSMSVLLMGAGIYLVGQGSSQAQTVLAFLCFALIAAIVTFGFLGSSGIVKTKKYQFGGAAAIFLVTFTSMLVFARDTNMTVNGILYVGGVPPAKATVYLLETETRDNIRILDERDQGKFEFKNVAGLVESQLAFSVSVPGYKPKVIRLPYAAGHLVRLEVAINQLEPVERAPEPEAKPEDPKPTTPISEPAPAATDSLPVVAIFNSAAGPLPNEDSRTSPNGAVSPPEGAKVYVWKITGPANPSTITFNITHDVTWGSDETAFGNLHDGSETPAVKLADVYVSAVKGASGPFRVEVRAR